MDLHSVNFWLGTWDGGWLLLPLVSVFGGAWAFTDLAEQGKVLPLAVTLVLAGWAPLWRAIVTTDWATPLASWRAWRDADPLPYWPYLQPGTPGALLYRALGQALSWWRAVGAAVLALPLRSVFFALLIALLLSAALGRLAVLLTVFLLTLAEFAVLWHDGQGQVGAGWEALALVGVPWLLGASLAGEIVLPVLSMIVVSFFVGSYTRTGRLAFVGPVVAALFLFWQGAPFAAGVLLLLAFPGLMLVINHVEAARYRRAVLPWAFVILLLFAGVL